MGKSASCFKIIACGGDSRENGGIGITESKRLNDKQGWSFRKRSSRQRVLSNTVITEISSPKESFDSPASATNSQQPGNCFILEKNAGIPGPDEKTQSLAAEYSKEFEVVNALQSKSKADIGMEEFFIIVIQTAIRRLLAQEALLKLKNLAKLQAVVRGHLVRKHAVGTLRCFVAITKMQALVRARWAHSDLKRLESYELDAECMKDSNGHGALKKKLKKSRATYVSIEKLLCNRFVRQLLESMAKTKSINISYDPTRSEYTWKWLERWTSFSSTDVLELEKAELMTEEQGGQKEENLCVSQVKTGADFDVLSKSADFRAYNGGSVIHSESEDNLITYDMDSSKFQPCQVTFPMTDTLKQSWLGDTSTLNVKETTMENLLLDQKMQLVADSQIEFQPHLGKLGTEIAECKNSATVFSSGQLEVLEKKTVFGLRKASNPAFTAAQAKFQELSSIENSAVSVSSCHDTEFESCIGVVSSTSNTGLRTEKTNATVDFIPPGSRTVQVGGSECGTELSITSTLDSPDLSEAGAFEYEHENNLTEVCVQDHSSRKSTEVEVGNAPTIIALNLSEPVFESMAKPDVVSSESIHTMIVESSLAEANPEINAPDLRREQNIEAGNYKTRLSPSAFPKSQVTILESQATPSSQTSQKYYKKKIDTSRSNQKRKSLSAGKKLLPNPHQNSDSSSNLEALSKDQKNGKKRNSFGSARSDHIEEESRESNASQSVPHFMRATESARAKVQLNCSPRSSPDVQDTEVYIKKRHSLPGANGRQASPRIERSISQANQSGKGNERKWQR